MAEQQSAGRPQPDTPQNDAQRPAQPMGARSRRLLGRGAAALAVVLLAVTLLRTHSTPGGQATCAASGTTTGLAPGQCAPKFTLDDVRGRPVSLRQFSGHPILLHFWAVACTTCAAEYPDFSRAVRTYVPKGLTVLAVDAWGEPATQVQGWQAQHYLPARLLIDQPQAVVRMYQVPGTPTSFFIDRGGRIRSSNAGPLTYGDFKSNISRIL